MPFEHRPRVINYLVAEFYTLEALVLLCNEKFIPFKHSHERFRQDLFEYKTHYESRLASAMYEYIVYAIAGEARHAEDKATEYLPELPNGGCRSAIIGKIEEYSPLSIAKETSEIFLNATWEDGYGGYKWYTIAQAILLYHKLPTTAFIDHVVDLSHNGGSCFNKDDYRIFFVEPNYAYFLSKKTEAKEPCDLFEAVLHYALHVGCSHKLLGLISRAEMLGFLSRYKRYYNKYSDTSGSYGDYRDTVPALLNDFIYTKWGTEDLMGYTDEGCYRECCEDEDYDEDCSGDCDECSNKDCSSHPFQSCDEDCLGNDCSYSECPEHPSNKPWMYYWDFNDYVYKLKTGGRKNVRVVQQGEEEHEKGEEEAA